MPRKNDTSNKLATEKQKKNTMLLVFVIDMEHMILYIQYTAVSFDILTSEKDYISVRQRLTLKYAVRMVCCSTAV